jgi:hypothetical protein
MTRNALPEWTAKYAGLVLWQPGSRPVDGESVAAAASAVADWLDTVQAISHGGHHSFTSRDTCEAGMCPDYRAYAERLRVAIAGGGVQGYAVGMRGRL